MGAGELHSAALLIDGVRPLAGSQMPKLMANPDGFQLIVPTLLFVAPYFFPSVFEV